MASVFAFDHYKDFIRGYLDSEEKSWGLKSKICEAMSIHVAYLSQVLNSHKHLSLEQIEGLGHYLHLSENELDYLILLVQKDRAGTKSLEDFFARKLAALKDKHTEVSVRLGKKETLSEKDQAKYYSSWLFSAVHSCVLVPRLRSVKAIAARLKTNENEVSVALTFLREVGLIENTTEEIRPSSKWIRLKSDSPFMKQHHFNVRFKATESIFKERSEDLHYSGYFALSRQDFVNIKELWLKSLQATQKIIKPSPEEEIYAISLDVFEL